MKYILHLMLINSNSPSSTIPKILNIKYEMYKLKHTCDIRDAANLPCQKRGIKFTNIRQSMLKLKTHSARLP
jgi:hypothetical protein